jgi:hypothetical protein
MTSQSLSSHPFCSNIYNQFQQLRKKKKVREPEGNRPLGMHRHEWGNINNKLKEIEFDGED